MEALGVDVLKGLYGESSSIEARCREGSKLTSKIISICLCLGKQGHVIFFAFAKFLFESLPLSSGPRFV